MPDKAKNIEKPSRRRGLFTKQFYKIRCQRIFPVCDVDNHHELVSQRSSINSSDLLQATIAWLSVKHFAASLLNVTWVDTDLKDKFNPQTFF